MLGMLEDEKNNLWLSTSIGIVSLNAVRNEWSIYGKNFGINANLLNSVSSYKGADGQIYFGDSYGYYAFSPKKIMANARPPQVVITNLHIAA